MDLGWKRAVDWDDVEKYLKKYMGDIYTIILKGANAKAKANAAQGLPELIEIGEIERHNVFNVIMVVRHAQDGKMYLYDIMNIKKETSTLFRSEDVTQ